MLEFVTPEEAIELALQIGEEETAHIIETEHEAHTPVGIEWVTEGEHRTVQFYDV